MDEIDAISGRRFSEGTSADREIQRTLMEVRLFLGLYHRLVIHPCPVAESNGRFRLSGTDETHHGYEPTRYP